MADNGIGYSSLLVGLTDAEVETLLAAAEERSYGDGELIVEQNTPSDCLFILTDGAVQVEHREGARSIPLALLDQSGEMSLIDILPRSADIRACGPTMVLAFPMQALTTVFTEGPRFR
ncbi:MAG: cyclic nucleotide-binding domain-containing protein [Candidatus Latescibacteria bacterium]|nr:cyclic nucleotide-binding domain-containing protein [Candidatus Latescibacterota bacterium]